MRQTISDLIIRNALPTDLDQLVLLENACFTSDKMSRQSYRTLLKKKSAAIIVGEVDNIMIASATLFFRKNSTKARLYSIAVHPTYRKFGIAATLCQQLEKVAQQHSCHSILLEVRTDNTNAIQFYEKNGYKVFDTYTAFYEDGLDALRMQKQIL
jgi:ribosomal protein S18 acetylase RimI-like enzyme